MPNAGGIWKSVDRRIQEAKRPEHPGKALIQCFTSGSPPKRFFTAALPALGANRYIVKNELAISIEALTELYSLADIKSYLDVTSGDTAEEVAEGLLAQLEHR